MSHFFKDVETVLPEVNKNVTENKNEMEIEQIKDKMVTHQDLEDLANAFKESVAASFKENNEKLKTEMIDFLKHENIASNVILDEDPVENNDEKKEGEN